MGSPQPQVSHILYNFALGTLLNYKLWFSNLSLPYDLFGYFCFSLNIRFMKRFYYLQILVMWLAGFLNPISAFTQSSDSVIPYPKPKVISLNLQSSDYQELFHGAPQTVAMHSGLVTLTPGESVGTHNSENYEEIILFLEGEGVMFITDGDTLSVRKGEIAYCPPHTEHNLMATGEQPLKYVYVAARVLPEEFTPPQ